MRSRCKIQQWIPVVLFWAIASTTSTVIAAEFVSASGGFRADMGGQPVQTIRVAADNILQFQFAVESQNGVLMITYDDHPALESDDPDTVELFLDRAKERFVAAFSGSNVEDEVIAQSGLSGRELKFASARIGMNFRGRLFFVNKRGYSVFGLGSDEFLNHPRTLAYLNSFKLLKEPGEATGEFVELIDKAANFRAVMLPGVRFVSGNVPENPKEQTNIFAARGKKGIYGIVYQDVPNLEGNDFRRLAELTRNALNLMSGGNATKFTQTATKKVKQTGKEATQFDFQHENGIDQIRVRVFVVNDRVYSLCVGGLVDSFAAARPDEFLDSFKLLSAQPSETKATSVPSTKNPAQEPTAAKKPANADKASRKKAIQQLKDF